MVNNFDKWNIIKKSLDNRGNQSFYVKQREIWSVNMGQNVGFEEDGKGKSFERPVLILKKIGIVYLCLSMTTKGKDNDFYLGLSEGISREKSFLILSQPKLFDFKRFHYKIGVVPEKEFNKIQKKLKILWF